MDAPPASTSELTRGRPASLAVSVATLLVVGMVVPLVVAAYYGALDIPRSDDWSYLVTLFRWMDHGRLGFNDWVSMTLIGQLVIAAPVVAIFGNSIRAVHIFSAGIGFAGLLGLYAIGRQVLPRGRGALLLAVTIAVGPLWAPLAATYMTDVPAFALQMLSLAVAINAVRRPQLALTKLAIALGLGFVAISIRQYEVIPIIATLLVSGWIVVQEGDRRRIRSVATMAGILVIATVGLFAWWSSLPGSLSLSPDPQTSGLVANLVVQSAGFLRLTGLLLIPVIVWLDPIRIVRRAWNASRRITMTTVGVASAWLMITYIRSSETPFVGNYVDRHGVLSEDVLKGRRPLVMPARLFDLLVVAASIAGVVLLLAMVEPCTRFVARLRARDRSLNDPATTILALTVAGFASAYAIAIATKLPIFDRYALPAIPLVGLLTIVTMARSVPATVPTQDATAPTWTRLAATIVVTVLFAGIGLGFSTDSAAFDSARWKVDEATVRRGYSPLAIYGGFEWISYHRRRGPILGKSVEERQRLLRIYRRGLCVDVIVNPRPEFARRAIARATMGGIGHPSVQIVAIPSSRPCAR